MNQFIETFLQGETLERLFTHACNHASTFVHDPLTDTASLMVNTPVSAVFTTTGVMPFRECPSIIFPYVFMTQAQKDYVFDSLQNTGGNNVRFVRKSNCVELVFDGRNGGTRLKAHDVLLCLCTVVMRGHTDVVQQRKRLAICNVLLQRVRCNVHLAHDVFVFLHQELRTLFPLACRAGVQKAASMEDACDAEGQAAT